MTENERRILVEWMELVNDYINVDACYGIGASEMTEDYQRMKQLTAQLRDADKPAGGEG